MKIATCIHHEQISNVGSGINEGVCGKCHQVRRYEYRDSKSDLPEEARVIKLGRIDGRIVLPEPNELVTLSPEEAAELTVAREEAEDEFLKTTNPITRVEIEKAAEVEWLLKGERHHGNTRRRSS